MVDARQRIRELLEADITFVFGKTSQGIQIPDQLFVGETNGTVYIIPVETTARFGVHYAPPQRKPYENDPVPPETQVCYTPENPDGYTQIELTRKNGSSKPMTTTYRVYSRTPNPLPPAIYTQLDGGNLAELIQEDR
jgi:hypothetical protein